MSSDETHLIRSMLLTLRPAEACLINWIQQTEKTVAEEKKLSKSLNK